MSVPVDLSGIHTVEDLVAKMESAGYSVKKGGSNIGPKLDEKHFRRLEKFDGDRGKYREWLFNLEEVLGRVDTDLGKTVKELLRENIPDPSETQMDSHLDQEMQDNYSSEFYGVICDLTMGEAKKVVRAVSEKYHMQCGFAHVNCSICNIWHLNANNTTDSRLSRYACWLREPLILSGFRS